MSIRLRHLALPRPAQTRWYQSMTMSLDYTQHRKQELEENLRSVEEEINQASSSRPVRLVPISKIKPASDIKALYDAGQRHFGENYLQEMAEKAEILPRDIKWHFVGSLQSNKSKTLASIPNIYLLETLSSIKVADLLQKSLPDDQTLNVYLQVNTSSEDSKSGVPPLIDESEGHLIDLAQHVIRNCSRLKLLGLMTIGSWDASHDDTKPNPDFEQLKTSRKQLAKVLEWKEEDLELSMGMSADFVQAVKEGSSSVRVGTRIFGERPKKQ